MKRIYKILLTIACVDCSAFLLTVIIYSVVTGCVRLPNWLGYWGIFGVLGPIVIVGLVTMSVGLKYLWRDIP